MAKRQRFAAPRATVTSMRGTRSGDQVTSDPVRDFLRLARDRFQMCVDAESTQRAQMLYDKKFYNGDQWEPRHRAMRDSESRPCLTFNPLPTIGRQITNEGRAMRPAIQVVPVDSEADPKTAEVFQDIIRQIEVQSDSEAAYTTAQQSQVEMGLGWWRIVSEYEAEDSFDQVLRIKRIRNPFSVYVDPRAMELDKRDARFAFVTGWIDDFEYDARYGGRTGVSKTSLDAFSSTGDPNAVHWVKDKGKQLRIAEYYYVDEERAELVEIEIPGQGRLAVWQEVVSELKKALSEGVEIKEIRRRTVVRKQVKWCKIDAAHILDGNDDQTGGREWMSPYIPLIPVLGEETDIEGEVHLKGVTRDAQSPVRMMNFWVSAIAETIGTAPRAPFLVELDQVRGLDQWWDHLNTRNFPYLPYNARSKDGHLIPPPQRQQAEAPIQALVQGFMLAQGAVKAVTGFFGAALGEDPRQRSSGDQIDSLKQQSEMGASNYHSNVARAVRYTGEQLIILIPHIYDAQRILRIRGVDSSEKKVMVYSGQSKAPDNPQELMQQQELAGIYDLSAGRYDVVAEVGRRWDTKRQEAAQGFGDLVRANPQMFQMVGDLLLENLDWPGAKEAAARIKRMLPPQLQGPEQGQQATPDQLRAGLAQMQKQLQTMQQALQQAHQIIETDTVKSQAQMQMKQMELQSKEKMTILTTQAELAQIQARGANEQTLAELKGQIETLQQMLQAKLDQMTADEQPQGD